MAVLSGNMLKLLAAAAMVLDHAGLMFFPEARWMRIAGRLAFPIFAFMISEGCRYTRNKGKYFGGIFVLAVLCQAVYFLVDGSMYLSVLFTFSLAIVTIFSLEARQWYLPVLSVLGVWLLNRVATIDYGFWGCMAPVFPALLRGTRFDTLPARIAALGLGLLVLALDLGGWQFFALAALPMLLLYSGKRGKWKMKYFFYVFYPLHLALLQLIAWCVS